MRKKEFQRNLELEKLLEEISELLSQAEERIIVNYSSLHYPVVLVIGAPRSGTTLLMQWLASLGHFAYPTNLLSRFYAAPYIGARIQQLLTDPRYNFRNELVDFRHAVSFESSLGKTQGALSPNEFWYFWRRFIPNTEIEPLDDNGLKKIDSKSLLAEMAAIEAAFGKPFAAKGMILQYNLPFLASVFEKVVFLFIKRDPFYNIQSLLQAREKFFGTRDKWYSAKPKEYQVLKELSPEEQVAGQIYYTNQSIENQLETIPSSQSLAIRYEDFCREPDKHFDALRQKLAEHGYEINGAYQGVSNFENTNEIRLSPEDCERIIQAYRKFSGTEIHP